MSSLISNSTDPRRAQHAEALQAIQTQIDALKFEYADNTLAFKALDLAWEAARLDDTSLRRCLWQRVRVVPSWYAVRQETLEHYDQVASSLEWVRASSLSPDAGLSPRDAAPSVDNSSQRR